MPTSRIHLSYSRDEKTPPNIFTDHDWVRHQQAELLAEYGERFIVVYQEQVLGVGDTYEAALQSAESNLPPGDAEITPIVELLRKRQPFLRVRPSDIQLPARDNG
ncbi:MAG: hypothetical protein K8L91_09320 [Anaerolineae bacterium]|nr:hypothetical protein [Anaerolineae bacterium]